MSGSTVDTAHPARRVRHDVRDALAVMVFSAGHLVSAWPSCSSPSVRLGN